MVSTHEWRKPAASVVRPANATSAHTLCEDVCRMRPVEPFCGANEAAAAATTARAAVMATRAGEPCGGAMRGVGGEVKREPAEGGSAVKEGCQRVHVCGCRCPTRCGSGSGGAGLAIQALNAARSSRAETASESLWGRSRVPWSTNPRPLHTPSHPHLALRLRLRLRLRLPLRLDVRLQLLLLLRLRLRVPLPLPLPAATA